jgi:membrane-associated protease RseP (regulator of RpoE activity)
MQPAAFAGWTGLLVTALNLIPVGQLDGGHIAYALFGKRQNRYARILHWSLLGMFVFNAARFVTPVVMHRAWGDLSRAISNSVFWLVWFCLLHVLARVGGRDHPPTEPGALSPARKAVAIVCLAFFVLLFMPTPWTSY